jgi:rubrerythrin
MDRIEDLNKTGTRPVLARLTAMETVPSDIVTIDDEARGPSADELRATAANQAGAVGSMDDGSTPLAPPVLLNKLGGRLAFERSGVRLYDAILRKAEQDPLAAECVADLQHIRDEELEHFQLLTDVIISLEGDPTMETPCADLEGVMSSGLIAAVNDPRTSLVDAFQAALIAELADVDAWLQLTTHGASFLGEDQIKAFQQAEKEEEEHLRLIRKWHARFEGKLFMLAESSHGG